MLKQYTSPQRCIKALLKQESGLFFLWLLYFLEPLGGAGALWAMISSHSPSLTLAHPCNIMWDEGNCYGKLNEIKREKQLHSPLSCVISELSLWWSYPDGLRVWWSWQPAAPGPDGSPISGPPLFHGSLSPCESWYSSFFLSFLLSAGLMAFQLSPSLRADRSWPRVPRCVCMGFFFHVHMVHWGPFFCAHCEAFNRVLHTVSPPVGYNFWTGTRNGKKMSQKDTDKDTGREKHRALHPECLQHILELYQRPSFFVHRARFFLPWVHLPLGSSWKRRKAGPSWKDWPLISSPP